jgi:hypothetical protein
VIAISHILQFLQLCCEGHNSSMQNYLRNQDDTDRPVNLVAEALDLYHGYSKELISTFNDHRKTLWSSVMTSLLLRIIVLVAFILFAWLRLYVYQRVYN